MFSFSRHFKSHTQWPIEAAILQKNIRSSVQLLQKLFAKWATKAAILQKSSDRPIVLPQFLIFFYFWNYW